MSLFLIVYTLALLLLAFLSFRKKDSFQKYILADRNQPKFLIIASMLASTIGGGLTIGTVNKAFLIGFPAFWFVASGSIAHLTQGLFLSEKVRKTEALTLPDLAAKLSSPQVGRLAGIIIVLTWTGIAGAQFLALSKVITTITGLGHAEAIIAAAAFLVIYTIMGGQRSILKSDFLQFGLLAISLIIAVVWLFTARPVSFPSLGISLFSPKFTPSDLLYYLVVVAGSYLICPMMFGRILSSDSAKSARTASFVSAAGMLLFAFVITAFGLWARASGFNPGSSDPLNAMISGVFPPILGFLMTFGILAAILSTADTVLLTAASVLEHDVIQGDSLYRTQTWVGVVAFFAAFVALFQTDIVDLLLKTYQGYTSGIVPALFIAIALYGRRRVRPIFLFAAILSGYLLGFTGSFLPSPALQKGFAFAGILVSTLISLLGIERKPNPSQTN